MIVLLTLAAVLFAGLSALWLLAVVVLWCGCAADTIRTFLRNWRNR
jgi:hypothetical protein